MEGETNNLLMVWILAVTSLFYCHTIGQIIKQGTTRLLAILPVIFLFLFLPLNLTTIYFGTLTAFFIAWLANFKLLLFAFGKGPLSSNPPLPLTRFIPVACFPIKIQHDPSPPNLEKSQDSTKFKYLSQQISQKSHKSPLNYTIKALIYASIVPVNERKEFIHPNIFLFLYAIYIYVSLEFALAIVSGPCRRLLGVELEPQFNEPYLSTSLQDFWGRRWNLMVSSILRPTVYNPVRTICSRLIGKKWASAPAVIAAFFVSGMMHELIFYYMGRLKPTWEVTCFFLLHGFCLALEIAVKKALNEKWQLPRAVSGIMVSAFVVFTGLWLFLPAFMRCEVVVKSQREAFALIEFLKEQIKFFGSVIGKFSTFLSLMI